MLWRDVIIKDTHRGLWYEDGHLARVLGAGRYRIPWHISTYPDLLRLRELDTLRELARLASARIYIGFPKHARRRSPAPYREPGRSSEPSLGTSG